MLKRYFLAMLLAVIGAYAQNAPAQESARLSITQTGDGYLLNVPISRLEVVIPSANFRREPTSFNSNSRYFSFSDPRRGLMLSGWLEHESGFKGLKGFWNNEQVAWDRSGLPKPVDIAFDNVGEWQIVFYRQPLPVPVGANSHMRAHLVKAGTWIDLHISVTSEDSISAQRELIDAVLKTIIVREKSSS